MTRNPAGLAGEYASMLIDATVRGCAVEEIVPELAQMVELSDSALWIWYIIIFGIAGLGILNTQRMSALERRREFGVLLAIGVTPNRLRNLLLKPADLQFRVLASKRL